MTIEIENLSVSRTHDRDVVCLLDGISLSVDQGEIVAVVGESGCGKTTLLRAISCLFPPSLKLSISGHIRFDGANLLDLDDESLRLIRAQQIRSIFQEPSQALNPLLRIRSHFHAIRTSNGIHRKEPSYGEVLRSVGIADTESVLNSFPHQLNGGLLQRVVIAMALHGNPNLILADEPTSALDVVLRHEILDLLGKLCRLNGNALLFSTHDIDLAREYADTVVVLYRGRVVESGPSKALFSRPLHPYSKLLLSKGRSDLEILESTLELHQVRAKSNDHLHGCRFHSNCPDGRESCTMVEPGLTTLEGKRQVRCPY